MSEHSIAKPYNPFLMDKLFTENKNQSASVIQNHKRNDFSERLNEILTEKSALKIDYHEVKRDLKAFGFPIKATQSTDYHSGLDTVRLKAGLRIMDMYFTDMFDADKKSHLPQMEHHFQTEVCKVFEILSRDYKRLSDNFSKKLSDKQKLNLPELEQDLKKHIEFYNYFTSLLGHYLNYITEGDDTLTPLEKNLD